MQPNDMTWQQHFYLCIHSFLGARGSVVGWGTMQQARRQRFRFSNRSLGIFNLPNPSSRNVALGSTRPLIDMSTRNLSGGKERAARKADNLTAIGEPII
jgi:hypothetical protein